MLKNSYSTCEINIWSWFIFITIHFANVKSTSVEKSLHYVLKDKFADGGPLWMSLVLVCLVLGLAFAIERIFYLNLASANSQKLLSKVEEALKNGGIEKAGA